MGNRSCRFLFVRVYWLMTLKYPAGGVMGLVAEVLVSVAVIGPPTFVHVFSSENIFVLPITWSS